MRKFAGIFFVSFLFAVCLTSCGKAKWTSSLEEAKKQASKDGRDIFMVISGGAETYDQFKTDVLDSKDFIANASKKFSLIFINLSADGLEGLTQEQLSAVYEENSKIIMDYSITDELTMLRLSSDGYVLAEFPFLEKYNESAELLTDLETSDDLVAEAKSVISTIKKSSGVDKAKAIDDLYEFTDEKYKAVLSSLCDEILTLDSENSTGLLGKYELINAYNEANQKLSPDTVDQCSNVFVDLVENGHLDSSQKFEAYFTAAYLYPLVGSTEFDKMCNLLEKAYEANPNNPHVSEVTDLLQNIKDLKAVYKNSEQKSYDEKSNDENSYDEEKYSDDEKFSEERADEQVDSVGDTQPPEIER